QDAVTDYSRIAGYNPQTGQNDNGVILLDMMKDWVNVGVTIAGGKHKLGAFTAANPASIQEAKLSTFVFGSACTGWALPQTCQGQKVWDLTSWGTSGPGTPNSWGGHYAPILHYNATGPVVCTWGGMTQATWRFFQAYCDEMYCPLLYEWLS